MCSSDTAGEILKDTRRTRLTLQPHQDGAKQLLTEYADHLVCGRYRYDERRKRRLKTVELIVEKSNWEPRAATCPDKRFVHIKVSLPEGDLQRRVKVAGGKWDRQRQAWEIQYDQVQALGLTGRIVDGKSYLPVYGRPIHGYMGPSTCRWSYLLVDGSDAVYQ